MLIYKVCQCAISFHKSQINLEMCVRGRSSCPFLDRLTSFSGPCKAHHKQFTHRRLCNVLCEEDVLFKGLDRPCLLLCFTTFFKKQHSVFVWKSWRQLLDITSDDTGNSSNPHSVSLDHNIYNVQTDFLNMDWSDIRSDIFESLYHQWVPVQGSQCWFWILLIHACDFSRLSLNLYWRCENHLCLLTVFFFKACFGANVVISFVIKPWWVFNVVHLEGSEVMSFITDVQRCLQILWIFWWYQSVDRKIHTFFSLCVLMKVFS